MSSFIFREYRDRSNVGYGTMLAMVYLVLIIIFVTLLLKLAEPLHAADVPEHEPTPCSDQIDTTRRIDRRAELAGRTRVLDLRRC